MKKLFLLSFVWSLFVIGSVNAADITIYYSPTCPHCHHALQFFTNELVYEYKTLKINPINVMDEKNLPAFKTALEKCKYDNGGVPLIMVGEKCFQGFGPKDKQVLQDAVAVDLSAQEKTNAAANIKAFNENPEKFREENSDRANVISGIYDTDQKKNEGGSINKTFVIIAILAVVSLVVLKKKRKK